MFEHPYRSLRAQVTGEVIEITLCRPELRNRMDELGHSELLRVFRELESPTEGRAVVFAAEGDAFSAGGDFDALLAYNADYAKRRDIVEEGQRLVEALLQIRLPVVAAVQGPAVGLGATVVLGCDVVVSHPECRILDPHVAIGAVAGDGGGLFWPQHAGMLRAKRHLLTGDPVTGEEAYRFGLVSDLADGPAGVLPMARAIAGRIAAMPPIAVQGTKRALNSVLRHRLEEVLPISLAEEHISLASRDLREAIDAFRTKRPGEFEGR